MTFSDLERALRMRSVSALTQPTCFQRIPEERRRHLSAAGGMPLAMLEEARQASSRFKIVRGLDALPALARAVTTDRLELGFVDILSNEGALDHPLLGPEGRALLAAGARGERRAAAEPEPGGGPRAHRERRGRRSRSSQRPAPADAAAVVHGARGDRDGPNGKAWDCGACGYGPAGSRPPRRCQGGPALKQCPPHEERRADEAVRAAAVDVLTGLATYRVLQERLQYEIERSKRSDEAFAVLFIDLDSFKQVNDRHGHEAGNDILRAVAAEIRAAVRASDVAAAVRGR